MRKNTKIIIAVLAVVVAALMVLPMITALIPQKNNISPEDIYYADGDEEMPVDESRDLFKMHLTEAFDAVSFGKPGTEGEEYTYVREFTGLEGHDGYDKEAVIEAAREYYEGTENKEDLLKGFDKAYNEYIDLSEEHEIMDTLKEVFDSLR